MKVPLLDLNAQHDPIRSEIMKAMERVLDSNHFILGSEVEELEKRVASYSGARFGVGVSSGTDALLISLMALEIGPGDEVITSPYSFFATAGTVARVGAKPVFADIDQSTYNLEPGKIHAAITPRTKAIIPVHLYGQCADMKPIMETAKLHNLHVIEDAAQAIGAEYRDGLRAGSMGTLGCLSFFPSKNLGALGDGGMVLTNDPELAEKIRILRAHGGKPKYYHKLIGGNFRLDALQAAVLNVKLNHLEDWTARRRQNAKNYVTLFKKSTLLEKANLQLPVAAYAECGVRHPHIYNQFVIRVCERDQLRDFLKSKEIGTEVYYPVPFHLQECFQHLGYSKGAFPEAERAAKETLALPIYPELTEEQQEAVVGAIADFYAIRDSSVSAPAYAGS